MEVDFFTCLQKKIYPQKKTQSYPQQCFGTFKKKFLDLWNSKYHADNNSDIAKTMEIKKTKQN